MTPETLRAALRATHPEWADAPLQPLADSGLAHQHVRLQGTGVLARLPKQSQLGLPPEANLRHQAACFERAAASGHTPRLLGVLPVGPRLPRGGLLVQDIAGRPPALPRELPALARALAAIHRLPLPVPSQRAPLADPRDPLKELLAEIGQQARYVAEAGLDDAVRAWIADELRALEDLAARAQRPARCLIAFDAHPGNFLIRADGEAVLVDLEKCRYGYPGLDLAHATLLTSTTWDVATRAVLTPTEVAGFIDAWSQAVGAEPAQAARPWHLPLRRAMALWSLTWCCKWRVLSRLPAAAPEVGEDWSSSRSDPALVAHVRERVDHYLSPEAMAFQRAEWAELARHLPT